MNEFYKISAERLTEIADRVRVMAGLTRKMTPAEIVDWLSKVKFMPMTVGESEFELNFESTSIGRLPEVVKSVAVSDFELGFNCAAIGILPAVAKASAQSEFVLNFESTAVGALQEE